MNNIKKIMFIIFFQSFALFAKEIIPIGIIKPRNNSQEENQKIQLLKQEFNKVMGKEYEVKVENIKTFSTLQELEKNISSLKNNRNIKGILALDEFSGKYLENIKTNKIKLTPFVENIDLSQGIKEFNEIYKMKKITILTSADLGIKEKNLISNIKKTYKGEVEITYFESNKNITGDGIIIYNPLNKKEYFIKNTIQTYLKQGIPSFSINEERYLEYGALVNIESKTNDIKNIRQSILKLDESISNDYIPLKEKNKIVNEITFNLSTANILQVYPNENILNKINLWGELDNIDGKLTLNEAIDLSLKSNLSLKTKKNQLSAVSYDSKLATSKMKPEINLFSTYENVDSTISSVQPYDGENTLRGGIEFKQVIFNDSIFTNSAVEKELYKSYKEDFKRVEINTVFLSSKNYIEILKKEAKLNIEKDNLNLTKEFLNISENRLKSGVTDASDVYRFKSLYADSLSSVKKGNGDLKNAKINLNQNLNLPIDNNYAYEQIDSFKENLLSYNSSFINIIENPFKTNEFKEYLVKTSLKNLPELNSVDYKISAQEKKLKSISRKRFTPEIALAGKVYGDMREPWGENSDNKNKENYWTLGVTAKVPLYKGGEISYEKSQENYHLQSLESKRAEIEENMDKLISSKLSDISVLYENYKNAKVSKELARKSLEMVKDNYAKGTVSIADLIDAKNNFVDSNEKEEISKYDYIIKVLDLERVVGKYYFSLDSLNKLSLDNTLKEIQGGKVSEK